MLWVMLWRNVWGTSPRCVVVSVTIVHVINKVSTKRIVVMENSKDYSDIHHLQMYISVELRLQLTIVRSPSQGALYIKELVRTVVDNSTPSHPRSHVSWGSTTSPGPVPSYHRLSTTVYTALYWHYLRLDTPRLRHSSITLEVRLAMSFL